MRLHLLLLLLASVLLASCNPEPSAGPRVDLVGATRYLSASRTSTSPADTFTTRVFADKRNSDDANISRLLITVDYTPTPNPYAYPATGFNRDNILPKVFSLVYLDSMVQGSQQRAVAFQFTANTRTTSGRELWTFRAFDTDGASNARSYQLSLRNADSALVVYHRYSLLLPAPSNAGSRSYLSLLPGLTLPSVSLRQSPENQNLIDLVYFQLPNGGRALATPNDPEFVARSAFWTTRRATQLRATTLDSAAFATADTTAILSAFSQSTALGIPTRTGPLAARGSGRVLAFRTADRKTGLIFIQSFLTAPTPAMRLQVRITK